MSFLSLMDNKALSLLEIIISTVILALVITGLVNVFVAAKGYIWHSRMRMDGGEVGRRFLDPLQAYVKADTWDDPAKNCFKSGNIAQCVGIISSLGSYSATYDISTLASDPNIKKVTATIAWTE